MHQPVLLKEVVNFLEPKTGDFIIDGTVDGGGHAAAILRTMGSSGLFLGLDLDKKMIEECRERIAAISNFQFPISKIILIDGNYADLPEILEKRNLPKADGLLLDLGFSSEQIENSNRGFSFQRDEPLLMTYEDSRKPVREILKEISEKELAKIIFELSGEKFARKIAQAIKMNEKIKFVETSRELNEIIKKAVPKNYERGRIEPATRTFQALRIYANDELNNLEKVLKNLPKILKREGRIVVISFHSSEDRVVKNNFREMAKNEILKILTKKPVRPSVGEVESNPRSHSARLRAAAII